MTTKSPAIDDPPSLPLITLNENENGDGAIRVKCPCGGGGLPGSCARCGGAGVLVRMSRCLGCGNMHGGSGQEEMRCLRLALVATRKRGFEVDEAAAHRAYVAFGEALAAHRETRFVDEWVPSRGKGLPEPARQAWRAAVKAAAGR